MVPENNMMMTSIVVLAVLAIFSATPASTYTYPVFGTKRYHRTGGNSYATPVMRAQPVYTTNVQHYYDEPPSEEDSYYYYPPNHHSPDHTYGLPTYRGEYKPTPYYYAPGPSYNYYDDRVEVNNPMDDLHEEIMQEDQRERDMVDQDEEWYERPVVQPPRLPPMHDDTMTNNFLRNLIMYNKQLADQKAPDTIPDDDLEQEDDYDEEYFERQPHQMNAPPPPPSPPQQPQMHNSPHPHSRQMTPPYMGGGGGELLNQGYGSNDNYNNYHQQNARKNLEDKEVKELQQLTSTKTKLNNQRTYLPWAEEQQHHPANHNNYNMAAVQPQQNTASLVNNYEEDPEYDDDAWINWDSKRSVNRITQMQNYPMDAEVPIALAAATTTKAPQLSTKFPTSFGAKLFGGQKEVVLPRPATPVKNPFASPVLDMLNNVGSDGKEQAQQQPKETVYDSIKHLITMQQNLQKQTAAAMSAGGAPKIQRKRFVSNEESLVQELDQLKRRAM